VKCEVRFTICLYLPQAAWDLDENNLCKDRNVCWDFESEICSAKNVRLIFCLLICNKLCVLLVVLNIIQTYGKAQPLL